MPKIISLKKTSLKKILVQGAEAILTRSGSKVIKDRIKKGYRHPALDQKLRKRRTKAEIKLLTKASKLISAPKIISPTTSQTKTQLSYNSEKVGKYPLATSKADNFEIQMDYISGKKLSDNLEKTDYKKICKIIGKNIAKLHDAGIIHGDLTTSNMILYSSKTKSQNKNKKSQKFHDNKINKHKSDLIINERAKRTQSIGQNRSQQLSNSKKQEVFFIDFGLGFHSNRIEDKAVDLHLIKQALEAKHPTIFEKAFKSILSGYKLSKNYEKTINQLKKVEKRGRYKQQY